MTRRRSAPLAALFSGRDPAVFALFEALEKLVRRNGRATVVPEKTRIVFRVERPFLVIAPRQMHLIGHFVFAARVPHPRFQKIGTISRGQVAHHFCLERADDLDSDFEGWVREAYALGSAPEGSSPVPAKG